MEESIFFEAVELAKAGRKAEARGLIQQVLSANPFNEMAWLWYADCAVNEEERIRDLETGLRLNPNMPRVVAGLRALRRGKTSDLGRTQPVFISQTENRSNDRTSSRHVAPFYGLEDDVMSEQQDSPVEVKPQADPASDVVFENGHVLTSWASVFTVLPDRIAPEEFAEIEQRTVSLLTKHVHPRYADAWKSFRDAPEPEPRPIAPVKENGARMHSLGLSSD